MKKKLDNQLNDKNTLFHNKIFDVVLNMDSRLTKQVHASSNAHSQLTVGR